MNLNLVFANSAIVVLGALRIIFFSCCISLFHFLHTFNRFILSEKGKRFGLTATKGRIWLPKKHPVL